MQSMVRLLDGFAWRRIGFMCACLAAFSFLPRPNAWHNVGHARRLEVVLRARPR